MSILEKAAVSLSGVYQAVLDGTVHSIRIPGTLDENNIGEEARTAVHAEADAYSENRYYRKYQYEGPVRISRLLTFEEAPELRYFVEAERARSLKLFLDEEEVLPFRPGTLLSPWVFEVTGKIDGSHMLTFLSDNSYPDWPREEILASNMASDDTATNWNGLLGEVRVRSEEQLFVESASVGFDGDRLTVRAVLSAPEAFEEVVELSSKVFEEPVFKHVSGEAGFTEFTAEAVIRKEAERFGEGAGNLHELRIKAAGHTWSVRFGLRTLKAGKNGFALNERTIFLRGETNVSLHPETACPPTRKEVWAGIFRQYAAYGVNFVRFASHCPPEAAFDAADECGMLLMPELSHDGGRDVPLSDEAKEYYREELRALIRTYGSHPSFAAVGLPFGETEAAFASGLIALGKEEAPELLFAGTAFTALQNADFLVQDYVPVLTDPDRPLVYTGVGPSSMLPDFREIDLFSGVLEPRKLIAFEEAVRKAPYSGSWEAYVAESGETALLRYRETIDHLVLEPSVSGILLNSLQECPSKHEKPRGMLSSHYVPKQYPFSAPERFKAFFGSIRPMAALWRTAFFASETPSIPVYVLNAGNETLNAPLFFHISDGKISYSGEIPDVEVLPGDRKRVGELPLPLADFAPEDGKNTRVALRLRFKGREIVYTLYVYPESFPVCPESVLETSVFDHRAMDFLKAGGNVFLTPPMPETEEPVCQTIEAEHPLFRRFVTGSYTDERWIRLADKPGFRLPPRIRPIVGALPGKPGEPLTAQMFEARILNGMILVSSLGLKEKIDLPEAAALLSDIYDYMDSYEFSPSREMTVRELQSILGTI